MTTHGDNEEFNSDELEAPEWLNEAFFTRVLKHSEHDEYIELLDLKISPASAKGDHYASVMFRATVEYIQHDGEKKHISMIIKTMPEIEGHKKDLLQESHIFETEIGMYTEVIPRFHQILRDVGDESMLGARCLYYSLSPKKLIVLEDLVPQGFRVLRERPLTMEEGEGVYMKLAKWHAISYKLNHEEPAFLDKYSYSFMTMPNILENEFMKDGIKFFIELTKNDGRLSAYTAHFEALRDTLLSKTRDSFLEYRENRQPQAPYVLCHGDFHAKNMMFKNDTRTDTFGDVMLLDFQFCYIGPMINDLLYSRFALLNEEQRIEKWDEMLYFYFSNFRQTLQKIGFKGRIPKLPELRAQLADHKHLQLFLATTFLPMWFALHAGKSDPNKMMTNSDFRRSLYYIEEYIKCLEILLKEFLHLGFFE